MDIHKNARLTPKGRERVVREVLSGQTPKAAALGSAFSTSIVVTARRR
jgi:hypothetical protein